MTRSQKIRSSLVLATAVVLYFAFTEVLSRINRNQDNIPDIYGKNSFTPARYVSRPRTYGTADAPSVTMPTILHHSSAHYAPAQTFTYVQPTAAMGSTSGAGIYLTSSAQVHTYGSGGGSAAGGQSYAQRTSNASAGIGTNIVVTMPSLPARAYKPQVTQVGATEAPELSYTADAAFGSPRRLPGGGGGGVDFGGENGGSGVENTGFEEPLGSCIGALLFFALCYAAAIFIRRRRAKHTQERDPRRSLSCVGVPIGWFASGARTKKEALSSLFFVVPTGIEPVTQGFSVLCSTN